MIARMAAEADGQDLDDRYVTSCYILMREFGCLDIEVIKRMPATTFDMLLNEMKKQNDRDKEEANRNKYRGYK